MRPVLILPEGVVIETSAPVNVVGSIGLLNVTWIADTSVATPPTGSTLTTVRGTSAEYPPKSSP